MSLPAESEKQKMTAFRYTGPEPRYYPDRGLFAVAGDVLDLPGDAPDDGRWQPAGDAAPTVHTPEVQAAEDALKAAEAALAAAEAAPGAHAAPEDPNAAPTQEG